MSKRGSANMSKRGSANMSKRGYPPEDNNQRRPCEGVTLLDRGVLGPFASTASRRRNFPGEEGSSGAGGVSAGQPLRYIKYGFQEAIEQEFPAYQLGQNVRKRRPAVTASGQPLLRW
jgi:hypothetical protein